MSATNTESAGLLSPEQVAEMQKAAERMHSFKLQYPGLANATLANDFIALLADRATLQAFFDARDKELCQAFDEFRQQVATELAGLLIPEAYTEPEPGERTYALHPESKREVRALREQARLDKIRAAATCLGIDLT